MNTSGYLQPCLLWPGSVIVHRRSPHLRVVAHDSRASSLDVCLNVKRCLHRTWTGLSSAGTCRIRTGRMRSGHVEAIRAQLGGRVLRRRERGLQALPALGEIAVDLPEAAHTDDQA